LIGPATGTQSPAKQKLLQRENTPGNPEEQSKKNSKKNSTKKPDEKPQEKPQEKPENSEENADETARKNLSKSDDARRKPMSPEPTAATGRSPSPASGPAAHDRASAAIRYVDRADMVETFADSITGLIFDGQTLRVEFGVTRFDDMKPNAPITGRRYPACRLVLPPAAAIDLINRMQQIAAALTQAGVMRQSQRPAAPPSSESAAASRVR
jgi:hypothetical protein